jgi:hypothetical protein
LIYFKASRKPAAAGAATNCLSCDAERDCLYSAKKIYHENRLLKKDFGFPLKIIVPEIEDIFNRQGLEAAEKKLMDRLGEDYPADTPAEEIDARPWFGRCVYSARNDVCDEQVVTITWDDSPVQE